MSVWEIKSKRKEEQPRYIVSTVETGSRKNREAVKDQYNGSHDFADFDVFAKSLKLIQHIPLHLAIGIRGTYVGKEALKKRLQTVKDQAEADASEAATVLSKLE